MQILQNLKNKAKRPEQAKENPRSNLSPNLLDRKFDDKNFFNSQKEPISKFTKYPIFGLQFLFVAVVVLNYFSNQKLSNLEDRTWEYEQILRGQSSVYEDARILDQQIELYKDIELYRVSFSKRVDEVFSSLSPSVEMERVTFTTLQPTSTRVRALVSLTVPDALSVALIISRMADLKDIEQVTLHSASFNPRSGSFAIDLELDIL